MVHTRTPDEVTEIDPLMSSDEKELPGQAVMLCFSSVESGWDLGRDTRV